MKKTVTVTLDNAELTQILGGRLTCSFGDFLFNDTVVYDMLKDTEDALLVEIQEKIISVVRTELATNLLKDAAIADTHISYIGINYFRSGIPLGAVVHFALY